MQLSYPEPYSFGGWHPGLGRMGSSTLPSQVGLITSAGTAVGAALNAVSTAGMVGASVTAAADTAAALLLATGVGAPIAAVVAAAGNLLGPIIDQFNGCGQTCVQATAIANNIGGPMAQAFQAYMNAPVHYYTSQQMFLTLFNQLMASLKNACGNPALGAAGQNCIADNSPGACHWKASPGGWNQDGSGKWTYTYWGAAGSGNACWNPYTGIYNEVLNDPTVVPDPPASATSSPGSVGGSPGSTATTPDMSSSWLALAIVGIVIAVVML